MKIRTALTLKDTAITATVFLLCLTMVYLLSEQARSETFFRQLRSEAVTKAHLFLAGQTDARTMQSIYLNNRKFIDEVEVAVYTPKFKMLYHDAIQSDIVKETPGMIRAILRQKQIAFYEGAYQSIGMIYRFKGKPYVITAAAYDGYGYANLVELRKTLFLLFLIGLSLLFVVSYLLARLSLNPIRRIVEEVENITAKHIDRRLFVKCANDELGELAIAFNALLERLEKSFEAQKMFVSNVAHELRNPLAAITTELDVALQKRRTEPQYVDAMQNVLHDAKRMSRLIDGLLNLAKADYQREQISMKEVRLDEILLDVRTLILRSHPDYSIELIFDEEDSDDERCVTVNANPYLLSIAFSNLIENNCKYSDNKLSSVQISFWKEWSIIRLSDSGKGMTDIDKRNLFNLFYRGEGEKIVEGHGIGMALTQKIILLHGGEIAVHSQRGSGTTFIVKLLHV